jgi:hypothetical protein
MDAQALDLHRRRVDEVKHVFPHNRRPLTTSLADLRRRRIRRRMAERLRVHLQELAAAYAIERLFST